MKKKIQILIYIQATFDGIALFKKQ